MAELKNEDEEVQQQQQDAHGIPSKRKTEVISVDEQDIAADYGKKQRSENSSADINCSETKFDEEEDEDEEDYEQEEDEDEDEDDEDEDFDEEHSNGEVVEVDRKGKGVLREDKKGKGKMIQESDDDDSSDDGDGGVGGGGSDGGVESDGDGSDLSEDPLAEVDLDNILPSRTRRGRTAFRPGVCLSKGKNGDS